MNLIDRNKVIDKLNILRKLCPDLRTSKMKRDLLHDIEQLPIIEAEPKWIPCSDGLPKEYGEYLCTLQGEHDNGTSQQCSFDPDGRHKWSTCDADGFVSLRDDEVVAWRELPDPYKGENDE